MIPFFPSCWHQLCFQTFWKMECRAADMGSMAHFSNLAGMPSAPGARPFFSRRMARLTSSIDGWSVATPGSTVGFALTLSGTCDGLWQGCILSPLLFLLVMDWILKWAADGSNCGMQWEENTRLTDLDFADDITLLDNTWEGMMELTGKIEKEAESVGLWINADKTKLLVAGNVGASQIIAGGKQVEKVEEFCYLGSMITSDSKADRDIKIRLGKAHATFTWLDNIWRSKSLNLKIKIRLYESLVMSTLLYGAETWPMTVTNMKKLEAAHHKWQRRILGVTWKDKIRNEKYEKGQEWRH